MGFLFCMRICEYVEPDSEHAGFQAFVPTVRVATMSPGQGAMQDEAGMLSQERHTKER